MVDFKSSVRNRDLKALRSLELFCVVSLSGTLRLHIRKNPGCPVLCQHATRIEKSSGAVHASPTQGTVDVSPTHRAVDARPTHSASDGSPSHSAVDANPTHGAVDVGPTHGAVDVGPTHSAVDSIPTHGAIHGSPLSRYPTRWLFPFQEGKKLISNHPAVHGTVYRQV